MKKTNKLFAAALSMILAASLAACSAPAASSSEAAAKDTSLDDVKAAGTLTIATSPDFPPFESLDESGNVVGIEIDILNKVCEGMGVTLTIEQMDFDSVLPGVQAGKYDAGVSGITVTPERQNNADFSSVYFLASQAIVVTPDSAIASKADLEGKSISVQTGTTAEEYCMGEGYDVQAFQANNDAATALTTGKVDAWVVDNEVAVAFAEDLGLVVLDEAMTSEPYAFAFQKGSDALVAAVNEQLDAMLADGTIAAIFEEWEVFYVAPNN